MVQVLLLLALALLVAALARRRGWSAPLLLVLVGLLVSFVPRVPATNSIRPGPARVLAAAAVRRGLGKLVPEPAANLRPVVLLSVGLVLFTTLTVGYVMNALVPGLGLAAALALGAIVAPPGRGGGHGHRSRDGIAPPPDHHPGGREPHQRRDGADGLPRGRGSRHRCRLFAPGGPRGVRARRAGVSRSASSAPSSSSD